MALIRLGNVLVDWDRVSAVMMERNATQVELWFYFDAPEPLVVGRLEGEMALGAWQYMLRDGRFKAFANNMGPSFAVDLSRVGGVFAQPGNGDGVLTLLLQNGQATHVQLPAGLAGRIVGGFVNGG